MKFLSQPTLSNSPKHLEHLPTQSIVVIVFYFSSLSTNQLSSSEKIYEKI